MKPRLRNKTKHYKDGKESQPWLQAWWDVAKVPVLRGWKISSRLPWAAKQDPISRKQFKKKKIAYEMEKEVQSDNTWKLFWPNQKVVASRLLCIFQTGHTWHPLHPGPDTLPSSATQMSGILLHSYWLLIFPTPTVFILCNPCLLFACSTYKVLFSFLQSSWPKPPARSDNCQHARPVSCPVLS